MVLTFITLKMTILYCLSYPHENNTRLSFISFEHLYHMRWINKSEIFLNQFQSMIFWLNYNYVNQMCGV